MDEKGLLDHLEVTLTEGLDGIGGSIGYAIEKHTEAICGTISSNFCADNEADNLGQHGANVVDGLFAIARGLHDIASAIREKAKP